MIWQGTIDCYWSKRDGLIQLEMLYKISTTNRFDLFMYLRDELNKYKVTMYILLFSSWVSNVSESGGFSLAVASGQENNSMHLRHLMVIIPKVLAQSLHGKFTTAF